MINLLKRIFGTGARAFIALVGITGISLGIANYTATQGLGTDFGSRVNGTVHYAQQLLCDMNIASVSGNCAAVMPGNTIAASTTAIAVGGQLTATSVQSGTWTVTSNVGTGTRPVSQSSTPWPVSLTSTSITGTIAATQSGSWTVTVGNTLTAISMGDGVTTGNFPSGSPVFWGLFNGTTYDRPRSAGPTGFTGVTLTPISLANGYALVKGTTSAMTVTAITTMISGVTSNRLYITRIKCNNTSSTATLVQIQDGSGGTVLDTLAAGATYGGEQGTGPTPLFWTTAGNGLFAQNVTTGASVICTASGYAG